MSLGQHVDMDEIFRLEDNGVRPGSVFVNPGSVLVEADKITSQDRNEAYGPPRKNLQNTADLWRVYLRGKYGVDLPLTYRDVGWMMTHVKCSRDTHEEKRDNLVDTCGWMRAIEMAENDE